MVIFLNLWCLLFMFSNCSLPELELPRKQFRESLTFSLFNSTTCCFLIFFSFFFDATDFSYCAAPIDSNVNENHLNHVLKLVM